MINDKVENNNFFHSWSIEKITNHFFSHPIEGLSLAEAKKRLEENGFNEIPEKKAVHPVFIFLKQFNSWLIYILIGAAVFSFLTDHLFDVYIILSVLLFNAIIGFIQEYKAEKAIKALKKMVVPFAKVIREGDLLKIPAREIVPGDVIFLEEGDRIPADARLLEVKNFRTMEAALTGESSSISKTIKPLTKEIGLADQKNMVWLGTFSAVGQAKAIVIAIGLNTSLGKIAQSLEKVEILKTHFKRKTDLLAKQMGAIALFSSFFVFLVGFIFGHLGFIETFRFTVALLVSSIPEGLPAVLIIVLAVGAHRMAKRNAIVRTLQATETLGVANVIATDKTGTLTQNTMNVEKIILLDQEEIKVTGNGWEPKGEFIQKQEIIFPLENLQLRKLLHVAGISNNARLIKEEDNQENYKIIGDPTEASLVVLAEKAGLKKEILLEKEKRIDDLPFNSELKYRASLAVLSEKENEKQVYVIGAPEVILKNSKYCLKDKEEKFTEENKKEFLRKIDDLAKQGLRVIALAYKPLSLETNELTEKMVENIVFIGLVGMKDPPRLEVKEAIIKAKKAGIRVIMKTGDHKETALAIAKEIGMISFSNNDSLALTQGELEEMTEEVFDEKVKQINVFARLTPQMKLRILESLQKQGYIVAMTGDGVNDALALKRADIGIAMGQIGTDVARESSDMVLVDDNFVSIINAIEEGRTVFNNIKKASLFLITTNFAEIVTLIFSLIIGIYLWDETFLIILPATILFLNLVTDGFADAPLALEPRHEDVLNQPPRKQQENILSKDVVPFLFLMIIIMTFLTIFIFNFFFDNYSLEKARAGAFAVMAITQLFNIFNMRSFTQSIFKIGFFSNKLIVAGLFISTLLIILSLFVESIATRFGFIVLSFSEFLIIVLISSSVLWVGEIYKLFKRKKNGM
jgi:P-type Ca2+ transporter type 2C